MSVSLKDQLGRSVHFKNRPQRIVSLVPSQTELLCDLGLAEQLVGVTKFCVHPKYIKSQSTIVGGTKQVHFDKIRQLNPDIVLCNKEENTKAIVDGCREICPVHISDIFTIADSVELIAQYGALFDKKAQAKILIAQIEDELRQFETFIKPYTVKKVAYFIWKNPWMVAGGSTFIDYLLKLNKFENVYGKKMRYPEIEWSISKANHDVELVLLSSEPFPFTEEHKEEAVKIYPKATVLLVDGEMFSWYGSRLAKAFNYFKKLRLNL